MKKNYWMLFGSIASALIFGWIGGETTYINEAFSAICVVLATISLLIALFSAVTILAE